MPAGLLVGICGVALSAYSLVLLYIVFGLTHGALGKLNPPHLELERAGDVSPRKRPFRRTIVACRAC